MIQIRTPVEDALVRYGIQIYRNEMRVVLKITPPGCLYGRGHQRHVSPLAVPEEGGIMRAQTDLRRPPPNALSYLLPLCHQGEAHETSGL
jgi:hypothetical protein